MVTTYSDLHARYSEGSLELLTPIELPEGAEVLVSITPLTGEPQERRSGKHSSRYPNRTFPLERLGELAGIVALGGDAVEDTEALYDE